MGKRILRLRLLSLLSVSLVGSLLGPISRVSAVDGADYPFRTGKEAFVNGVTWTGPTEEKNYWQYFQVAFDGGAKDLSSADYLAVQYRADVGGPGMTIGLTVSGDRFGSAGVADNVVTPLFMDEEGVVSDLSKILYASVTIPQGKTGALLLPLKELGWQWNNAGSSLASITHFYMTTNSLYNRDWKVSIGEIGYFTGDPRTDTAVYAALFDVKSAAKPASYYYDSHLDTSVDVINGYPLPVGEKAFNGGHKWSGPAAETGDTWETLFINFKTKVDLSAAKAIAVQYRADIGGPGLTWGVENSGTRYSVTVNEGKQVYFQDEGELNLYNVATITYGAVNIPQGKVGIALIPMDSIGHQFGDVANTLAGVNNILLTTNTKFNYAFTVSVGAAGYIDNDDVYHPIEIDNYYHTEGTTGELIDIQDWKIAEHADYPFRTGENAYENGKIWVAPATGSTVDDIQVLRISFDEPANLTNASYLAIQFANTAGSPGLTYAIKTATHTYSIANVADGEKLYWIKEDGDIATAAVVNYSAATTSISSGALLIPMAALGVSETSNVDAVLSLEITTNRRYNYNFQAKFGEIGFYTGEIGEEAATFTKVFDLATSKASQFFTLGSATDESKLIETSERKIYGDSLINVTATGKSAANYDVWTGGSFASVTMVKDTYEDDAVQLKATGNNPEGDAYAAITMAPGAAGWGGREGVTFWARNDSEGEISFNVEIDNRIVETGLTDRFNIKQGHRFWLYDVNTGKTSIYMTKPTATLPVGFEGWVRIPFSAFNRADWSNNGVTKDLFMSEGTTVTYLAITIHASAYLNMPFSLNKFGAYATTPTWTSPYVSGSSIPELMDLVG